ncbi:MAG: DUF933 domain-containing protein [Victivallales bacterium]|nr:DUF933 domain-containing protein [Victivallales bacterium]
MKIAYHGLDIPEGKVKYDDPVVSELTAKFEPKKVSPYFFEFSPDDFEKADAIVICEESVLDLLILDMEKLENRLERLDAESPDVALLKSSIEFLESEKPLCDMDFSDEESPVITELAPLSLKPTLVVEEADPDDLNALIKKIMDKAEVMFFYTAGKPEVHAWFVPKESDIVTCAGKIHSDLARGFIKGEVMSYEGYREAHNLNDARSKGLTRLVDRDYIVCEGEVIEIRFNV